MDATEPPKPERRGATGQGVVDFLSDAIRGGRFAPGQRLVEVDLTRELGVSRGPVREALRRLAAEGLIEVVPNRGALVRRLSATEALELFEIRTELEAFAARRAAEAMRAPDARARFRCAVAAIWDTAPRHSTAAYIAENQRFHAAIIEAAGNRQLVALNWRLQLSLILAQIGAALTSQVVAASLAEHRAIAAAILDGDAAAADRAIRDHLGRATALLRTMPPEVFRQERPRTVVPQATRE
jgi:DNA-binding GntR family transcriptional regulator